MLEVYAGATLVKRFLSIDKLSAAYGTEDTAPRPYRFGSGVLDADLNRRADPWEKRVYFEFSDTRRRTSSTRTPTDRLPARH